MRTANALAYLALLAGCCCTDRGAVSIPTEGVKDVALTGTLRPTSMELDGRTLYTSVIKVESAPDGLRSLVGTEVNVADIVSIYDTGQPIDAVERLNGRRVAITGTLFPAPT